MRRPLSSDLALEPISAPSGSILDLVEDAAEEMFDTVPGAQRAALESDAMRTAEMDGAQLKKLLPKTRPKRSSETVAMRAPRTEEETEPSMPAQALDPERLLDRVEPRSRNLSWKILIAFALIAAAVVWFLR